MSILGALCGIGDSVLIVGLSDDEPDGSMRVYLNMRSTGIHTHVSDPDAKDHIRRQWAGSIHLYADVPKSDWCDCPDPTP